MKIQLTFQNDERKFADKTLRLLCRIMPDCKVSYEAGAKFSCYYIQGVRK